MLSPMDSTVHSSGLVSSGTSASAEYRKKRIKNVQKLELVRLMKAHFLFIRGKHAVARCEKSRADVWKMITALLNGLGPPVQSAEAWQRRWNDMRSATKSKMAKIQNYAREHGEVCPHKLNLVERLIWDTFSVKPEEYMKDLNMKLWREKFHPEHGILGQQCSAVPAIEGESVCRAYVSIDRTIESGRNNLSIADKAGDEHWSGSFFASGRETLPLSNQSCVSVDSDRIGDLIAPMGCFYPQLPSSSGYGTYQTNGTSSASASGRNVAEPNPWINSFSSLDDREDPNVCESKPTVPMDFAPGSKVLRDLNKLFDLVLRQNEEILNLLRQSCCEH